MICDGSMNAPMTNGHYVIVSTGSRGIGGFTSTGVAKDACPLGGATQEAENCNNDTTFFDDICARSDRNNASYYDDIVWPINVAPSRIWVYSNAAVPDPTDIVSVVTKIGINNPAPFNNPGDPNGVDVRGNILAGDGTTPGRVISDIMCDVNGNNCFKPDLIGGLPDPRNNCDLSARGAMRGLGNPDGHPLGGHAVCQTSYLPSASTVCGPGQFAIGFQGGRIRCYTPP